MGKKDRCTVFEYNNDRLWPRNSTVKYHNSFFGVAILFLFSVSDCSFLVLIGCTGSLSMGAFFPIIARQRERDEDDCQRSSKLKMI